VPARPSRPLSPPSCDTVTAAIALIASNPSSLDQLRVYAIQKQFGKDADHRASPASTRSPARASASAGVNGVSSQ